jgi:hypothetical protein
MPTPTGPAPAEDTREDATLSPPAQPKKSGGRGRPRKVEQPGLVKVKSKVRNKYHPYQQITITETQWITLPMDNWLEVQIKAGVLEKA